MPASVTKGNPLLEKKWTEAKHIAAKEGKGGNFAYITAVFKRLTGQDRAEPKGERDKGGEAREPAKDKRREMLAMAAKRKLHAMRARGEG